MNINTDNWSKRQIFLVGMLAGIVVVIALFCVVHGGMNKRSDWDHMKGDRYGNDNYGNDTRGDLPRGVQPVPGVVDQGVEDTDGNRQSPSTKPTTGKLKADVFTGKLESVDTGCFADGECFIMVDGKHVRAIMGWSQETVGSVVGVDSFGDLEKHIGEYVEVYAQDLMSTENMFTLYGSEGFYIKLLGKTTPAVN